MSVQNHRHLVLWDGDCGMCRNAMSWLRHKDSKHLFETSAYQVAPTPPMTLELTAACELAVHVVKADGEILRAGKAVLFMLENIGYRSIAKFLGIPPFIWMVELMYKFVANNRPFLAHFMFRREYKS